jgi:hypothetical protein
MIKSNQIGEKLLRKVFFMWSMISYESYVFLMGSHSITTCNIRSSKLEIKPKSCKRKLIQVFKISLRTLS